MVNLVVGNARLTYNHANLILCRYIVMDCMQGLGIASSILLVFLGLMALNNFIATNFVDDQVRVCGCVSVVRGEWRSSEVNGGHRSSVERGEQRQMCLWICRATWWYTSSTRGSKRGDEKSIPETEIAPERRQGDGGGVEGN